jgi:hypothetical protein
MPVPWAERRRAHWGLSGGGGGGWERHTVQIPADGGPYEDSDYPGSILIYVNAPAVYVLFEGDGAPGDGRGEMYQGVFWEGWAETIVVRFNVTGVGAYGYEFGLKRWGLDALAYNYWSSVAQPEVAGQGPLDDAVFVGDFGGWLDGMLSGTFWGGHSG